MLKKSLVALLIVAAITSSTASVTSFAAPSPQKSFQNCVDSTGTPAPSNTNTSPTTSSGGGYGGYPPSDPTIVDSGDGAGLWEGLVSSGGDPGWWTIEIVNQLNDLSDLLH